MDTYKKGEYIAVMTNQPSIHFLEMFGHGLSTDNVKPSKYVGKIMNVIDDENYQILIVHPTPVYRCVIHVSEILRKVSETELDEDSKGVEENIEFLAPNVYVNNAELNGDSADDKCTALAELAMKSMFPMYQITSFEMASSELLKTDLIDCIDWLIKANMNHDEWFVRNLKKKGQYFSKMLQNLRFKEYYTIRVGVKDEDEPASAYYFYLFIDTRFEEVVITRNIQERSRFFRSVGPEYASISEYLSDFRCEVLTGEECIKLSAIK